MRGGAREHNTGLHAEHSDVRAPRQRLQSHVAQSADIRPVQQHRLQVTDRRKVPKHDSPSTVVAHNFCGKLRFFADPDLVIRCRARARIDRTTETRVSTNRSFSMGSDRLGRNPIEIRPKIESVR